MTAAGRQLAVEFSGCVGIRQVSDTLRSDVTGSLRVSRIANLIRATSARIYSAINCASRTTVSARCPNRTRSRRITASVSQHSHEISVNSLETMVQLGPAIFKV
jgi:hypothetical protein